jgi:uncharacterized protein YpuA (DUF1002 family)
MDKKEALRQAIRELIKKELDEMSTTGMVAGYLTPMAFRGNKKTNVDRAKHLANQTGYKLTSKGEKDANRPADKMEVVTHELAENKYYQYRNDDTKSPHKKIADAISQLNKNLQEVERVIKMNARLKNESGITSEQLWKRTQQGLLKLEAKLLGIATRIREIRGQ